MRIASRRRTASVMPRKFMMGPSRSTATGGGKSLQGLWASQARRCQVACGRCSPGPDPPRAPNPPAPRRGSPRRPCWCQHRCCPRPRNRLAGHQLGHNLEAERPAGRAEDGPNHVCKAGAWMGNSTSGTSDALDASGEVLAHHAHHWGLQSVRLPAKATIRSHLSKLLETAHAPAPNGTCHGSQSMPSTSMSSPSPRMKMESATYSSRRRSRAESPTEAICRNASRKRPVQAAMTARARHTAADSLAEMV